MKCRREILVKALPVVLLFAFSMNCAGASDPNNVAARQDRTELKVTIDPRVELMSVIFHLAGNPEYNKCKSKPYMRNLNEHFAGHRNHPAVKKTRRVTS